MHSLTVSVFCSPIGLQTSSEILQSLTYLLCVRVSTSTWLRNSMHFPMSCRAGGDASNNLLHSLSAALRNKHCACNSYFVTRYQFSVECTQLKYTVRDRVQWNGHISYLIKYNMKLFCCPIQRRIHRSMYIRLNFVQN